MGNKKKDIENSHDDYMLYSYDKQAARIDHFKEISYDKGIERGKNEEKIELIKNMRKADISIDKIKKVTGFSAQQIRNICL